MGLKDFLKPAIGRIILFLLLMGGLNYLWISGTHVLDARVLVGLPLGFWPIGGFYLQVGEVAPVVNFSWINFIIDIAFWYVVACAIVSLFNKIAKK